MGPGAQAAAPALIEALSSRNEKVVNAAAGALGRSVPRPRGGGAAPQIAGPVPMSRSASTSSTLGKSGPGRRARSRDLTTALKDAHADVRREAAVALANVVRGQIRDSRAGRALSDENGAVTLHAPGRWAGLVRTPCRPWPRPSKIRSCSTCGDDSGRPGTGGEACGRALAGLLAGYDRELNEDERDFCAKSC